MQTAYVNLEAQVKIRLILISKKKKSHLVKCLCNILPFSKHLEKKK